MMLWQRVTPWAPISQLRREMDRLFGDFLTEGNGGSTHAGRAFPTLNVWDEGERLMVEAEVPGLSMNDLEVVVQGNELTLRGQRKVADSEKATFHRRERAGGPFARTITLPVEIAGDKVEASLNQGVLTIVLPKAEAAKARRIEVKGGA